MKILVVEDCRSSLGILVQYAKRFGASAIPAENGSAALAAFVGERPDLVLLNSTLPDISGFEVAQKIRAQETPGDWTPIIFLVSPDDDVDIEKGISAGGDDYLPKPFSEIVLGAKIRAMQRIVLMRASLLALTRKLDAANQELIRISSSDSLTGIANRRYFEEALSIEWRRARRHSNPIALLMCDIDFFKLFNDTYGHLAGDDCLRSVAGVLAHCAERGTDLVARYGGEEFVILLPRTPLRDAEMVAKRLWQAMNEEPFIAMGISIRATVSIGIAELTENIEDLDTLMRHADEALYQAKQAGRNQWVVWKSKASEATK